MQAVANEKNVVDKIRHQNTSVRTSTDKSRTISGSTNVLRDCNNASVQDAIVDMEKEHCQRKL